MKVSELRDALAKSPDDNEVVICVNTPGGYVCPDGAFVDISTIIPQGMDWHTGLTEIIPMNKLNVANVDNWSHRKRDY